MVDFRHPSGSSKREGAAEHSHVILVKYPFSTTNNLIQTLHWSRPPSLAIKMQDELDAGAVLRREHEGLATLSDHILGSTKHSAT